MAKYHQGKYSIKHPEKYIGDPQNIVYRSGYELKLFRFADSSEKVSRWASEEFYIPYIHPMDNKPHRYFPDVYLELSSGKKLLIEVKPFSQTIPPKPSRRKTKRYLTESVTYAVNKAKWDYAHAFCKKRGWEFRIFTENELRI